MIIAPLKTRTHLSTHDYAPKIRASHVVLVLSLLGVASPVRAQTHSVTSSLFTDLRVYREPSGECQDTPAGQNAASRDRVCLRQEASAIVLDIYHANGIGSAQVHRPQSGWPAIFRVRLHHFSALEGFSARSSAATFTCGQSRPEGIRARLDCRLAEVAIGVVERKPEYFEVLLPKVLLEGASPVEIAWVDQWR